MKRSSSSRSRTRSNSAARRKLPEITIRRARLRRCRAITLELNKHHWTLGIGAKPAPSDTQLDALAKSFAVVKAIAGWSHRDGIAETVGWDAVKAQASGDVGFLVLAAPDAGGGIEVRRLCAVGARARGGSGGGAGGCAAPHDDVVIDQHGRRARGRETFARTSAPTKRAGSSATSTSAFAASSARRRSARPRRSRCSSRRSSATRR